ncbi:DUF2283 domain-containing protein [Nocardia sp. 004]|uniref:DUF2283 domain-containing protein n=1 Tax=Nocardia sp. 004 TaxID=3385978 RepID=UPI0039A15229
MLVDDGFRDDSPVDAVKGPKGSRAKQTGSRARKVHNPFSPMSRSRSPQGLSRYGEAERDYFPRPNQFRLFEQRYMDFTKLTYELAASPSEALSVRFDDVNSDTHEVTISGTIVDTELRVRQLKEIIEQYRLPPEAACSDAAEPTESSAEMEDSSSMRIRYDPEADAAYIALKPISVGEPVRQQIVPISDGEVILDFDKNNLLIGIEVLGAGDILHPRTLESAERYK